MGHYRLACEFDVVRRIGWSDEDLGQHVDEVFERLRQADGIKGMDATADLDSGRTSVSLMMSSFDGDPQRVACASLGVAIRSCGGVHEGLIPLGEEAVVRPERNQWSGLRTPTWRVRLIDFGETSPA